MSDRLTVEERARYAAAERAVKRAEVDLRTAQAERDRVVLDLQDAHAVGPGDQIRADATIVRAEAPVQNGRAVDMVGGLQHGSER